MYSTYLSQKKLKKKIIIITGIVLLFAALLIANIKDAMQIEPQGIITISQNPKDSSNVDVATNSEKKLQQIASIFSPISIDTIGNYFISPVGIINNVKDESGTQASYSSLKTHRSGSGILNNFVVYNAKSNTSEIIFSQKTSITTWKSFQLDSLINLVMIGTNADSNKDYRLNQFDFQKIFYYSIKQKKLHEFAFPNQTVLSFERLPKTNLIQIVTGLDLDKDKIYDYLKEPKRVHILNLKSSKVNSLPSENQIKNIQNILN